MATTQSDAADNIDNQRILSHFVKHQLRQNGGQVPIERVTMNIDNYVDISANEAEELIDQGVNQGIYTVDRGANENQVITAVSPRGDEPSVVADIFGTGEHVSFVQIDGVDQTTNEALHNAGYHNFQDLLNEDPEKVIEDVRNELDHLASEADFTEITLVTESLAESLKENDITSYRDLAQLDPETVSDLGATITTEQAKQITNLAEEKAITFTRDAAETLIENAPQEIPAGLRVALEQNRQYNDQLADEDAEGVVRDMKNAMEPPGNRKINSHPSLTVEDDEAFYISDVSTNEGDPKRTSLTVLDNPDHPDIPTPGEELPADENGNAIPPSIPTDPYLQQQVDVFLAQKLSRDGIVPVRVEGPRGSGKNMTINWIMYQTNRPVASIDVSKTTTSEDLFGTLSPNQEGIVVPRDGVVKKGLLNGYTVVINEFPAMQSGAAMALHRLLNEGKLLVKSHGELVEPHPEANIVITNNPTDDMQYSGNDEFNSATLDRFRAIQQPYPQDPEDETQTLLQQTNTRYNVIERDTLRQIVEFAHQTRDNRGWPTLSTRSLYVLCENIADGAAPKAAVKNQLWAVANKSERPEDAFETLDNYL